MKKYSLSISATTLFTLGSLVYLNSSNEKLLNEPNGVVKVKQKLNGLEKTHRVQSSNRLFGNSWKTNVTFSDNILTVKKGDPLVLTSSALGEFQDFTVTNEDEFEDRRTVTIRNDRYFGQIDMRIKDGEEAVLQGFLENKIDPLRSIEISNTLKSPQITSVPASKYRCLGASATHPNAPSVSWEDMVAAKKKQGEEEVAETAPIFNSRPGAPSVIYLDFDGETVNPGDNGATPWNSGNEIAATPPSLTNSQITGVLERVAEDFQPWNVTVTNDLTVYNSVVPQLRVRCIVTNYSEWYGDAGGVAYTFSFDNSTDNPCWVFANKLGQSEKNVAEAASHEVGHTLGLSHDGLSSLTYYSGHGSGPTGWAPIMGAGYSQQLVQWSKGEYNDANQQQDDLAQITNHLVNALGSDSSRGYMTDMAGDTIVDAAALPLMNINQVDFSGLIEQTEDVDLYAFSTGNGTATFNVTPSVKDPNLDIQIQILDSSGVVLYTDNPVDTLNASISQSLTTGLYFLKVEGVGKGDPLATGYTDYGSLGPYTVTGSIVDPGGFSPSPVAALSSGDKELVDGLPVSIEVTYTTPSGSTASGIDLSTLGSDDITVSGPAGTYQVTYVSATPGSGTPNSVVATYSIANLSGSWNSGSYVITLGANQVGDTNGNFVASAELGSFNGLVAFWEMSDSNPGFVLDTGWEWGQPQGNDGDPASANSGLNVLGYNLAGLYENDINPTRYATTPDISTLGYESVSFSFKRWLGVESSNWDKANVQYSVDGGTTWQTLWENPTSDVRDTAWVDQSFTLSGADNISNLKIRFGMGVTDSSVNFAGWNIDDIVIRGAAIDISTQLAPINFAKSTISAYDSRQDRGGVATTEENGNVLKIKGNGWKKIDFPYNVTADTILEFEFKSGVEGEIHGIGFDDNDFTTSAYHFQVHGTETYGSQAFNNYSGSDWKSYSIRVGDYFTGEFNYLTFPMDHDGGANDGESFFRNVKVYEFGQQEGVINFAPRPIEVYDTRQGTTAIASVHSGGSELRIKGNGWKKIALPYNVTADTVLEFEFRSDVQGEIHGIGFDNDDYTSSATNFQLYGTQTYGFQNYKTYTGSGWQSYQIRVGDHFTGSFTHLTFPMDHDGSPRDGESQFRNVRLYEDGRDETVFNFADKEITVYDARQDAGAVASVHSRGEELRVKGNGWKKIDFPYEVTANTVIEFDFRSDIEGEIHGIGFDTDDFTTGATNFQLHGTQTYGHQNFNTYGGSGWQSYQIRVGDYFTGNFNYLTFPMDHDSGARDGESQFRNLRIYEETPASGAVAAKQQDESDLEGAEGSTTLDQTIEESSLTTVSSTGVNSLSLSNGLEVWEDLELGVSKIGYERPMNYQDLGYYYDLKVSVTLDVDWELIADEDLEVTDSIREGYERVEYTLPAGNVTHHYDLDTNDPSLIE